MASINSFPEISSLSARANNAGKITAVGCPLTNR